VEAVPFVRERDFHNQLILCFQRIMSLLKHCQCDRLRLRGRTLGEILKNIVNRILSRIKDRLDNDSQNRVVCELYELFPPRKDHHKSEVANKIHYRNRT
jgi:hypothetical protein